ncbi:MAG: polysaccharide deacetylase family protein [Eubacterium sp.]
MQRNKQNRKYRHRIRFKPLFFVWIILIIGLIIFALGSYFKYQEKRKIEQQAIEQKIMAQEAEDQAIKEKLLQLNDKLLEKKHTQPSESVKTQGIITDQTLKDKLKSGETEGLKVVFFTFDDGPSAHTNEVLDLLKKHDIKGTFFTNGRKGDVAEAAYKRIVAEGHVLANHTWSHDYNLYAAPDQFYADVEALDTYQKQVTGLEETSHLFRFPGGSLNANKTCAQGLLDRGYNYVDWNVICGDGDSDQLSAATITQNFIDGVHRHDVSVLCHAELKETTRQALDDVFSILKSEGYTFLPMEADLMYPRQL